jgi:hypothetical protein
MTTAQTMAEPPAPRERQRHLWCRVCGDGPVTARGLCRRCYARHWFDRRFFGGLANGSGYGTVASAKRVAGPGAASGRFPSIIGGRGFPRIATFYCLPPLPCPHPPPAHGPDLLPTLLVQLWREQHPDGVE